MPDRYQPLSTSVSISFVSARSKEEIPYQDLFYKMPLRFLHPKSHCRSAHGEPSNGQLDLPLAIVKRLHSAWK